MSASQRERTSDSIRSPVYWALLGLLVERPGYGYGLIQRFEREYGEALALGSGSHIYEGLNVLEQAGLIEEHVSKARRQPTPRRQPTRHYRATSEGARIYADWLIARARSERLRSRLFARQLAALASEPELGLEVVGRYEQACLEEARANQVDIGGHPSGGADSLAVALPAEQARLSSEAELPWVSYARARFTELLNTERTVTDGAA